MDFLSNACVMVNTQVFTSDIYFPSSFILSEPNIDVKSPRKHADPENTHFKITGKKNWFNLESLFFRNQLTNK